VNERNWMMFTDLLQRIAEGWSGVTWREKRDELREKLRDYGGEQAFTEIVSWFQEDERGTNEQEEQERNGG
jgi:hypothetical protein